jgi:hypothetical protein
MKRPSSIALALSFACACGSAGESIATMDADLPGAPTAQSPPGSAADSESTGSLAVLFSEGRPRGACKAELRGRLAPAPLRRLSAPEYRNTIRDLFGVAAARVAVSLPDEAFTGVGQDAAQPTGADTLAQYREAAQLIALWATAPAQIGRLLPCSPNAPVAGCVEAFIREFGRKAFRRPLDDEQASELLELHQLGSQTDFTNGIRLVLRAMLESPYFLYHVESAPTADSAGAGMVALSGDELSARLSYFLWESMPDAELFRAAEAGELADKAAVRAQAERMLDDAKAAPALASFTDHWLGLGRLDRPAADDGRPVLSPEFIRAARNDAWRFVEHVVRGDDDRSLATLLTGTFAFPEQPLWSVYGVTPDPSYDASTPIPLPAGERAGVLTLPAVMAAHAGENISAIRRGGMVINSFLCADMWPPEVVRGPPPPPPGVSVRGQLEAFASPSSCQGCHARFQPLGFALDRYDFSGRLRDHDEAGAPIDTRVTLALRDNALTGELDGALELARKMAESDAVKSCMVRQFHRFALHRQDDELDTCSLLPVAEAFADSGFDMRELVLSLVTQDAFRFRAKE